MYHLLEIARALNVLERFGSEGGRYPVQVATGRDMLGALPGPAEVGTAALILDCVARLVPRWRVGHEIIAYLLTRLRSDSTIHFFENPELLPADTELTSFVVGLLWELDVLGIEVAQRVADRVLGCQDSEGRLLIYFDPGDRNNRLDHVSAINVLTFLGQMGRAWDAEGTIAWIDRVFEEGSYLEGSRYYHSPDAFLYFTARLVHRVPELGERWVLPLREALRMRVRTTTYPLDVAMRVTAQLWLDQQPAELKLLRALQQPDGRWPADSIYRYGGTRKGYFGHSSISTAFAFQALVVASETLGTQEQQVA